jgi:hypothetical protein
VVNGAAKPVFHVGQHFFSLRCENHKLRSLLERAWLAEPQSTVNSDVVDLDVESIMNDYARATGITDLTSCTADELEMIAVDGVRQAMSDYHQRLLYCHGAALLRPDGIRVLLVGLSYAGKTTLSLALCFGRQWRMVVEDIVYFHEHTVLVMRNPLSVRPPTPQLLEECGAVLPEPLIGRWIIAPEIFAQQPAELKFDLAVVMKEPVAGHLQVSSLAPGELLRLMLARSNALHFDDGADTIYKYIETARCYVLQGGTVGERCELLSQL